MIPDRKEYGSAVRKQKRLFPEEDLLPWWKKLGFSSNEELAQYFASYDEKCKFMQLRQGGNNKYIPAGYTYLGQFIAHELTFDPNTIRNSRHQESSNLSTPLFDLESIYGRGPIQNQEYFDQSKFAGRTHFYIVNEDSIAGHPDFPRTKRKTQDAAIHLPLIGDKRNDDNLIVSQLHIAIQRFHNKVIEDLLIKAKPNLEGRFREIINKLIDEQDKQKFPDMTIENLVVEALKIFDGPSPNTNIASVNSKKDGKGKKDYWGGGNADEALFNDIASVDVTSKSNQEKGFNEEELSLIPENYVDGQSKSEYVLQSLIYHSIRVSIHEEALSVFDDLFEKTKKIVQRHFQWVVLHDFLPKVVGVEIIEEILGRKLTEQRNPRNKSVKKMFLLRNGKPFVPKEFAAAVFRFGHSMVVRKYRFQRKPRKSDFVLKAKERFQPIKDIRLDWDLFFFTEGRLGNRSNHINPFISPPMGNSLQEAHASKSIIFRNLLRSMSDPPIGYGLPSGQDIALRVGISNPIGSCDFKSKFKDDYDELMKHFPNFSNGQDKADNFRKFCDDSPLWFYILMEAWVIADGKRLGPLGGRIVAEVLIGILEKDPNSFLKTKTWKPKYFKGPSLKNTNMQGDNSMIKLLQAAGVYP